LTVHRFYLACRRGHGRSSVKYAPSDKHFFAVSIMAKPLPPPPQNALTL
jgi:hypothetical protein